MITLGVFIFDVPLVVLFAWTMMAYPALIAARRIARGWVFLYGGAILMGWDLFLDPQMVAAGRWTWEVTGASTRNWQAYGHEINLSATMQEWQQNLITDPQTSGGLLISCAPQAEQEVIQLLQQSGFMQAKTIGRFTAGKGLGLV